MGKKSNEKNEEAKQKSKQKSSMLQNHDLSQHYWQTKRIQIVRVASFRLRMTREKF